MKRRLISSALLMVVLGVLVGGATFAYFIDQASNSGNAFAAGTVDIAVRRDLGDPVPGPMFYTTKPEGQLSGSSLPNWPTGQWYPGKSATRTLIVENKGTIDVYLDGLAAEVSNISEPAIAKEFAKEMHVLVRPQAMPGLVLYDGPLSGLTSGKVPAVNKIPVSVGGSWYLDFIVTMDTDAGNNLQGLEPMVAFNVYAIQNINLP